MSASNQYLLGVVDNLQRAVSTLSQARDHLFRIARARRTLLRQHGIADHTDSDQSRERSADASNIDQVRQVLAVTRGELKAALWKNDLLSRQCEAFTRAFEERGISLPSYEVPPRPAELADISELSISEVERDMESSTLQLEVITARRPFGHCCWCDVNDYVDDQCVERDDCALDGQGALVAPPSD